MELNFNSFTTILSITNNNQLNICSNKLKISNYNFSLFSEPQKISNLRNNFLTINSNKININNNEYITINFPFNKSIKTQELKISFSKFSENFIDFENNSKNFKRHNNKYFKIIYIDSFSLFSNIKKFKCISCQKSYKRKDYLTNHINLEHSGYTGAFCEYCHKKYKRIKDHLIVCKEKIKIKNDNNNLDIINELKNPITNKDKLIKLNKKNKKLIKNDKN